MTFNTSESSDEFEEPSIWLSVDFPFYIEGLSIAIVGTFGLVINGVAIFLLTRQKTLRTFHVLLVTLTMFDFLHIILSIACFSLPKLSPWYRNHVLIFIIPYLIPCAQITLASSSFSTVGLTIERYISVCWPYFCYRFRIRASYFIVPVITFSILYNVPRFFEWRTVSEVVEIPCQQRIFVTNDTNLVPGEVFLATDENILDSNCTDFVTNISLQARSLRKHPLYIAVYINWMNFIINLLIPIVGLIYLNCAIYRNMPRIRQFQAPSAPSGSCKRRTSYVVESEAARQQREQEQERDTRYTRASILMVIVFLLCHGPRFATNVMELMFYDESRTQPEWFHVLVSVTHFLVTVNSSFNFLIYFGACQRKCPCTRTGRQQGTDYDHSPLGHTAVTTTVPPGGLLHPNGSSPLNGSFRFNTRQQQTRPLSQESTNDCCGIMSSRAQRYGVQGSGSTFEVRHLTANPASAMDCNGIESEEHSF
ncbi:hypothetical protein TCAL_09774 [Tigriopus californicus]|uniref:G-protein coupled receptors family 1 profile domain-containing protein n=1 Tax=Tigriopus californicus TaxID=6832 RepID=A0A553PJT9_TIGCA|nr:FMRFamide receptor-like [Tigriopus californicus]TRY77947.1 hypothetical protein TCAL_09774 [Tigriopus californicus]